jgi:hypothetical protein
VLVQAPALAATRAVPAAVLAGRGEGPC